MSVETIGNREDCLSRPIVGTFAEADPQGPAPRALTLVCWNVERGVRFEALADALAGLLRSDLCLLQEVDLHTRRTGFQNVSEELARRLAMNYAFGAEFEELAQGGDSLRAFHGQAVLSRFSIRHARILRFEYQPYDWAPWWKPRIACLQPRRGGRIALVAEIGWGDSVTLVYNTHLESKASEHGRAVQMQEILQDVTDHYAREIPVIVAGDLNTRKGKNSPVIARLLSAQFRDVFEEESNPEGTPRRPGSRLDWIFLRCLSFSDARVHRLEISDHFPLAVRIARGETSQPDRGGIA